MNYSNHLLVRPDIHNSPAGGPVILRTYDAGCTGATAFFRNRAFIQNFSEILGSLQKNVRIMIHACSIGAEAYSIAAWWQKIIQPRLDFDLQIFASDINKNFLDYSQQGCYPIEALQGMTPREQTWFHTEGDTLLIPESIKTMVHFCQPSNFITDTLDAGGEPFDATLLMNALTYVSPAEQLQAIMNMASHTRHIMCLTAFHPDQIASDVAQAGFHPLLLNQRDIHNGWGERISSTPLKTDLPGYSWKLPPYETQSMDYEWRYASIFIRNI